MLGKFSYKIADAIEALIKSLGLTLPNPEGDRIAIPVRNDERKGPRNLPKRWVDALRETAKLSAYPIAISLAKNIRFLLFWILTKHNSQLVPNKILCVGVK